MTVPLRPWATNQLERPKRVCLHRTWFLLNSLAKESAIWIESGKRTEHNTKRNAKRKQLKSRCQNFYFQQREKNMTGFFFLSYPSKTYQNIISAHLGESTPREDPQHHKHKRSAHHGRIDGYDHGRSTWWVDIIRYM